MRQAEKNSQNFESEEKKKIEIEAEAPKDLESIAQEKILAIEKMDKELEERGEAGIDSANNSVGLSQEKVQEVAEKKGIREKMADLLNRVKENGKKKMLIMTLGMSMFANAGADINKETHSTEKQRIPKKLNLY